MWNRGIGTNRPVCRTLGAGTLLTLALAAACFMLSSNANASCKSLANTRATADRPEARSFQTEPSEQADLDTAEGEDLPITGLWHSIFVSDGQVVDEGFDLWNSDGTEVLNDNSAPQPPNSAGSVCLGIFEKVARRTYKLKHPFWIIDANGDLAGSGVFLERVAVARSGKTYRGSFTIISYDLNGNITDQVTGDIKAERIVVD